MEIAAIFFPGFHRDDHYDAWFGEGWNEWQLLQAAPPRFPGQRLLHPAWGYFDEADTRWMERQIGLAGDHGITAFLFDWYWYCGVRILYRPLEEGFLRACNRSRLKFAVMWANHHWADYFPGPYEGEAHMLLPIRHSAADFRRAIAYCLDRYFREPNYWTVNGKPYFGVFAPGDLVRLLGGVDAARTVLDEARSQAQAAGLPGIHFAAFAWDAGTAAFAGEAGFDSLASYNYAAGALSDGPTEDYAAMLDRGEEMWRALDTGGIPYSPVATMGLDASPRWALDTPWPPTWAEYPYSPITVGNTPDLFGEMCRRALRHAQSSALPPPAVFVNAWNEWTEGSALLPTVEHGTAYLEAMADALREAAR